MRILVLAPQPFFQERGTPIAVRLAVETLAEKLAHNRTPHHPIDLLVYDEGSDITIPGVRLMRVRTPRVLRGVRPGISIKKLLCDGLMALQVFSLLIRARSNQYDVIHAVEESVFIAWAARKIFGIPYIYDMDSSLALQLTERWWWCKPVLRVLQYLEGIAIRGSISVAPVCDALQVIARQHGSTSTVLLRDVSLLDSAEPPTEDSDTRFLGRINLTDKVLLYVGNLEPYQGIDLLIESFARIAHCLPHARLVIIGGTPDAIERYQSRVDSLQCSSQVVFLGARPLHELAVHLQAADILVSPRTKGNNTPMKIYSYLHSGTPVLATDLPTHQQVLNSSIALLARPNPEEFGDAMKRLMEDSELRHSLGTHARLVAQKLYTIEAFKSQMGILYDDVGKQLRAQITDMAQVQNQ
jgi:glycosyltransferase involved in cell wall biosynthesis